jgi:uncharacterized SAM-binding protein YcdF (DUF218 family)
MRRFRTYALRALRLGIVAITLWAIAIVGLAGAIFLRSHADERREVDTMVVLGAGLLANGQPGQALTRRSLHAAELWHEGLVERVVCTGGQTPGLPRSEAAACRELLQQQGVPSSAILEEGRSTSTEENARFAADVLASNGLNGRPVLLVSDGYHMLRAEMLFAQAGLDTVISPVPNTRITRRDYLWALGREVLAFHWHLAESLIGYLYPSFLSH